MHIILFFFLDMNTRGTFSCYWQEDTFFFFFRLCVYFFFFLKTWLPTKKKKKVTTTIHSCTKTQDYGVDKKKK